MADTTDIEELQAKVDELTEQTIALLEQYSGLRVTLSDLITSFANGDNIYLTSANAALQTVQEAEQSASSTLTAAQEAEANASDVLAQALAAEESATALLNEAKALAESLGTDTSTDTGYSDGIFYWSDSDDGVSTGSEFYWQ